MYKLYGGTFTRALAPQMVLEEAGLPYELHVVDMENQEFRGEVFRKINPAGFVPALQTPEGDILHEAAAIMLYLTDRHGLEELAPAPTDPQRGVFLSKIFYFTNDIQPSFKRSGYASRYALREEDAPALREQSREIICERWQILEDWLAANGPYHLGDRASCADLHLAMWMAYGFDEPLDFSERFPASRRMFDLCLERSVSGPMLQGLMDIMVAHRAA